MGRFAPSVPGSLSAVVFAVAIVVAIVGCNYKPAGNVSPSAKGGSSAGGVSGAGGRGGAGGAGGAAGSGRGGMTPIIHLDASASDGNDPDRNCGAKSKTATKIAPEILILLDRSGSMNDNIMNQMCTGDAGMGMTSAGCGPQSKWALMVPTLSQVVTETDADVNWGLKFFPDNMTNTCNVNTTAAVPVGPGNASAVAAAITGATATNGGVVGYNNTPTRGGTVGATTYLQSVMTPNPKFILLATDGIPTCATGGMGMTDDAAAQAAVAAAATAGFKTFVVGIATGGSADTTLSNLANAGGLPRQGTPSYYSVTTATDLSAAIRTLIGVAATCTFQVGPAPTDDGTTDVDFITVWGDGVEITRDTTHAGGYDYVDAAHQSIEVHGPLCDQIKRGAIKNVSVTFTCLVP